MGLGFGIWDPRSGIRKKAPDPGVKKAPDPEVKKAPDPGSGSATLSRTSYISRDEEGGRVGEEERSTSKIGGGVDQYGTCHAKQ
jgi:hypothetical protein